MINLEIAVAAPVRQTYTYGLPEDLSDGNSTRDVNLIGRRVLVNFGNRKITGYILGFAKHEKAKFEIKNICDILDESPLFFPTIIPLFRWISNYYHHPIGMVIKTALPAGLTVSQGKQLRLTNKKCFDQFVDSQESLQSQDWIKRLSDRGELSVSESRGILREKSSRRSVQHFAEKGCLAIDDTISRELVSKKLETCYRVILPMLENGNSRGAASGDQPEDVTELSGLVDYRSLAKSEKKTLQTLLQISKQNGRPDTPRKELRAAYPYGARIVTSLVEKGIVDILVKRIYRSPFGDMLPFFDKPEHLTEEQDLALTEINTCIEKNEFTTFLLHGITGSGKTEVYLKSAELTLETGRGVLVLVPEIALATQIEAHFVSRFGDEVALLHSGLSPGERYDEWCRISAGKARIVIGARSAVFAPLAKLGLIIVDEEHDSSFKQEDSLRYNGRDVAIVRARFNKAAVILGSATPSVTSFNHGIEGKYRLLKMQNRVGGRQLPQVSVVDLRKKKTTRNNHLFHKELQDRLLDTYQRKEQSILLLNRRGFSSSVICQDCGTMVECRHCHVTMNFHKGKKSLLCHYCGYSLPERNACNNCGSDRIANLGFGTERVVEEVQALLPDAVIARLDSDVAVDRKKFLNVLQTVRDGTTDILVGTQIIAKGLHFPNVTLVGIVIADGGLAFPDFRAAEKTYQLIAQVTGRAGRGEAPGHVVIQTLQPEHYAISFAAQHRYEDLAGKEIEIRKQAGFPPFTRLAAIRIEDRNERNARNRSHAVSAEARSWCHNNGYGGTITILGPAPAPIEKLRDFYRWQVLLKSDRVESLHDLSAHLGNKFQTGTRERVIIDIDPENML